jgi:uncharacterized membrane protein
LHLVLWSRKYWMPRPQDYIEEWVGAGRLREEDVRQALTVARVTPDAAEWRGFARMALLWVGVLLVAAGVIFFFASNWQAMGRMTKFGLAQGLVVLAIGACLYVGLDRAAGKAALQAGSLLTGALLALLGQTYQTGADTFELFGYWALLILPWVAVGRFGPLWLFWMLLVNTAVVMYFQAGRWGILGPLFGAQGVLWSLLALNAAAVVAWEWAIAVGVGWLERWGARILAVAAGGVATYVGVMAVVESREIWVGAFPVYVGWAGAMFWYYRRRVLDVFMLSGLVLSGIVVMSAFLGKHLLRSSDLEGLLVMGLAVIGLSAAGAWWIREVAREAGQ